MKDTTPNMKGKLCMVTGATSGIGQATAFAMAGLNAAVIIVGRDIGKCKKTVQRIKRASKNQHIDYLLADLSSQKDIYRLADSFKSKYQRLDILINNVGAKFVKRRETIDGLEMSFALNHLSYFILTNLLLPFMMKNREARIINVSSGAHAGCSGINFKDLQSAKSYIGKQAYAMSKLANILFTYELADRLNGRGVTVNALTPGGAATNFCKNNGWISWLKHITAHVLAGNLIGPAEAAKTSVYLASSNEVTGVSGKYFSKQTPVQSSAASYDKVAARRLWEISLELGGLSKSAATSFF